MVLIDAAFDPKAILTQYATKKAGTEDEFLLLLRALSVEYRHLGEARWSKTMEEFNMRSSETKSKHWIMLNAVKMDAESQDIDEDEHPSALDTSALALGLGAQNRQAVTELPKAAFNKDSVKDVEQGTIRAAADAGTPEAEPVRSGSHHSLGPARKFKVSYFVRAGGCCLGLCAGVVNAVSFHALGTFTSHHTGSISKVGMGIAGNDVADPLRSLGLILAFVAGSTSCGLIIAKSTVHFGLALYDIGLFGVCLLLSLATLLAEEESAIYLASAACGLQNGMATEWGGAVIRTTHVTGLFTDFGLLLGRLFSMFVRHGCGRTCDKADRTEAMDSLSKLSVLMTIGMGYLGGIVLGSLVHNSLGEKAFLVPAAFTGSVGFAYSLYRVLWLHEKFFSTAEMDSVELKVQVAQCDSNGTIQIMNSSTGEVMAYVLSPRSTPDVDPGASPFGFSPSSVNFHESSQSSTSSHARERADSKRSVDSDTHQLRGIAEDPKEEQKAQVEETI